jgi:anthranilate phosphoribosyltransferase
MTDALRDPLARVLDGVDLRGEEARAAMDAIACGEIADARIAAFLGALETKGVAASEIAGFARALRPRAVRVEAPLGAMDTCGTGGDGLGTFNVSTAAALLVAGAGLPVAKHGNRSASGSCGSADVLEALGVPIDLGPEEASDRLAKDGFAFLFAPRFHPVLARVAPLRRALGIRTVFNLLGPLLNPASVRRQVLGVPKRALVEPIASALVALGIERAIVVHGGGGLDELSTSGPNVLGEVQDGAVKLRVFDAASLGLPSGPVEALRGGDARECARIVEGVLDGESGPRRDVVALNAAAAFVVAGKAAGLEEGLDAAFDALDRGAGRRALEKARRRS